MTIQGIGVNLYKHYFNVLNLENNSVKDID